MSNQVADAANIISEQAARIKELEVLLAGAPKAELTDEQIVAIGRSMPQRPWGIGSRAQDSIPFARAVLAQAAPVVAASADKLPDSVIARAKRVMLAIDEYLDHQESGKRAAIRTALMDEFAALAAAPAASVAVPAEPILGAFLNKSGGVTLTAIPIEEMPKRHAFAGYLYAAPATPAAQAQQPAEKQRPGSDEWIAKLRQLVLDVSNASYFTGRQIEEDETYTKLMKEAQAADKRLLDYMLASVAEPVLTITGRVCEVGNLEELGRGFSLEIEGEHTDLTGLTEEETRAMAALYDKQVVIEVRAAPAPGLMEAE